MPRIWVAAVVALAWIVMAGNAQADTVYLKDGQALWGTDVYEEGDSVVVVRPGGAVKVPKGQVSKIERARSSLIPHYQVPGTAPAPAGEGPGGSAVPPGGAAPAPGGSPTALPPAPTPPPPPGTPK
jgi:hypothetical protein